MDILETPLGALPTLTLATELAYTALTDLAHRDDRAALFRDVFGDTSDSAIAQSFQQQWAEGDFSTLPTIDILPAPVLRGARGAFSSDTGRIYLSEEFVLQQANQPGAIAGVLLEEIGHFIDSRVNQVDTPGDEGAVFKAQVLQERLGTIKRQVLTYENDVASLDLDGRTITIERDVSTLLGDVTGAIADILDTFNDTKTLIEDVTSGLGQFLDNIQTSLNSGIFGSLLPLIGDSLLSDANEAINFLKGVSDEILTQLGRLDQISTLSAAQVRDTLFDALDGLGVISATAVSTDIPLGVATGFLSTVQSELTAGKSAPDALRTALGNALSGLPSTLFVGGVVPPVGTVLEDLLSEFSGVARGQLGWFESVLDAPLDLLREGLFVSLGSGGLGLLPPSFDSADDIPDAVVNSIFDAFLNPPADPAVALRNALQSALGSSGLDILPGGVLTDPVLEDILTEFQSRIVAPLSTVLNEVFAKPVQLVEDALNGVFGPGAIDVGAIANGLQFTLGFDTTDLPAPLTAVVPLDANIGLPGLGLTTDGTATVGLEFNANLGFGFTLGDGFYLNTTAAQELSVGLDASIDLVGTGELGFLQLDVTESPSETTGINLDFNVNLKDVNVDNKLTLAELTAPSTNFADLVEAQANGSADLHLNLVTSFGGSKVLPSIGTDLNIDWNFLNVGTNSSGGFGNSPNVSFDNVTLDLGSFFNDFVDPILDKIRTVLEPIQPLIDVLTTPLPVLTQIGGFLDKDDNGVVNLIDLAKFFSIGDTALGFLDGVIKLNTLATTLDTLTADGLDLNYGGFNLNGFDLRNPAFDLASVLPSSIADIGSIANSIIDQLDDFSSGGGAGASASGFIDSLGSPTGGELRFPILDDPAAVFGLLLGRNVDLFTYDMPALGFKAGFDLFFPIVGPLGAQISGSLGASVDLFFGYDTQGFADFASTGDAVQLLGGFYVGDLDPGANGIIEPGDVDVPEGEANAELNAYAAINVGIASAGVGGGIGGEIDVDLHDPNGDGKVRFLSELTDCLFELSGKITAGLNAFLKIDFWLFSFTLRFDIVKVTLLSFESGCNGGGDEDLNADIAVVLGNILRLNMGPYAEDRLIGGVEGDDDAAPEIFYVEANSDGTINVSTQGVNRNYSGFNLITANGGNLADTIALDESVAIAAVLAGGDGADQIVGGSASDVIDGDDEADSLYGGSGNDTINGGDGDDLLVGGAGADLLDGGDEFDLVSYKNSAVAVRFSPDGAGYFVGTGGDAEGDRLINIEQIQGSAYNDSLLGDDSDNVLEGFDGNDTLRGGEGDDLLYGGRGGDRLDGGEGDDGTTYISSNAGVFIDLNSGAAFGGDADGDTLISIEGVQGSIYDDFLIGNGADNALDGGYGNDQFRGGAGDDTLQGGAGIDWALYNTSLSAVDVSLEDGDGSGGDASGDELSGIENLRGSAFNDTLEGDAGGNILEGIGGNDELLGLLGNDALVGGAGADTLDGGGDLDLADYSKSNAGVNVNLNLGVGTGGHAQGDQFIQDGGYSTVENLLGSDYADVLVGDEGVNEINPGLSYGSSGGADFVDGGSEVLPLDLLVGDLLIIDYSLNDVGQGVTGGFNLGSAQTGAFVRLNGAGSALRDGVNFINIERLKIVGTTKNDIIYGGQYNDLIITDAGDDVVYGGRGNDEIRVGSGNDEVVAQNDVNRSFDSGTPSNAFIYLDGGAGIDTLSIDLSSKINTNTGAAFDITLTGGAPLILPDGSVTIVNFEVLKNVKTGGGSDRLTQLGRVNNRFTTGEGDDIVNPGIGFDTVDGGYNFGGESGGDDLLILDYSVDDTGSGIQAEIPSFNASDGGRYYRNTSDGLALLDETVFTNFERFNVTGTSKNDVLIGGTRNDVFVGNAGDDFIFGSWGDDLIAGNDNNDQLWGGRGNDTLQGGDGNDLIREDINLTDTITSGGNDLLDGGNGDDALNAGDGNDQVLGGAGTDLLIGGLGNDTLNGGAGDDQLIGINFGETPDVGDQIDQLTGGSGGDRFWLGDGSFVYYDDGDPHTNGNNNFALITDFNTAEGDVIQLRGSAASYSLATTSLSGVNYTLIYLGNISAGVGAIANIATPELIGIVQGAAGLSLADSAFAFV